MNFTIAENTPLRTIQDLFDEAKAMGWNITHKPDNLQNNVVSLSKHLEARRVMLANVSAEA